MFVCTLVDENWEVDKDYQRQDVWGSLDDKEINFHIL